MMCVCMVVTMVRIFNGSADVRSCQNGKYEGLYKSYNQFYSHHKQGKWNGHGRTNCTPDILSPDLPKIKIKPMKLRDGNVSGRNVARQTQHQGQWLDEQRHKFNTCQQIFLPEPQLRHPENVLPVMFIAIDVYNHKNHEGNDHGYRQVARNVDTTQKWHLSKKV